MKKALYSLVYTGEINGALKSKCVTVVGVLPNCWRRHVVSYIGYGRRRVESVCQITWPWVPGRPGGSTIM